MEDHLFFVWSNVVYIECVWYFTFMCPNSAIISDSCDCVGFQVCILVEFSFPRIFKEDFVPFVVRVIFLIVIFSQISLIN